jgi:hypothetical protein
MTLQPDTSYIPGGLDTIAHDANTTTPQLSTTIIPHNMRRGCQGHKRVALKWLPTPSPLCELRILCHEGTKTKIHSTWKHRTYDLKATNNSIQDTCYVISLAAALNEAHVNASNIFVLPPALI